jgi:hypothetical protein
MAKPHIPTRSHPTKPDATSASAIVAVLIIASPIVAQAPHSDFSSAAGRASRIDANIHALTKI